jgi:hypothetical protein
LTLLETCDFLFSTLPEFRYKKQRNYKDSIRITQARKQQNDRLQLMPDEQHRGLSKPNSKTTRDSIREIKKLFLIIT